LGNAALMAQTAAVDEWHINAAEPAVLDYNMEFKTPAQRQSLYAPDEFRISDHDPVLVDFNLGPSPVTPPAAVALPTTGSDPFSVWVLLTTVLVLLGLGVSALVTRRTAA